MNLATILGIFVVFNVTFLVNSNQVPMLLQLRSCQINEFFNSIFQCDKTDVEAYIFHSKCDAYVLQNTKSPPIFLFFDINSSEGFNLRRDVYIRMAVFVKSLRRHFGYENARLVLPPFYQLYHWQTGALRRHSSKNMDEIVFWNHFFDMQSLSRFVEVIDIWEYFEIMRDCFVDDRGDGISFNRLDHVFKLKHFESMFDNGKFEEKFQVQDSCDSDERRRIGNQFINLYTNISVERFYCAEFQGGAGLLYDLLKIYPKKPFRKTFSVAFLNAETILHDHWGDAEFWAARRSMRFNTHLVEVANAFRQIELNSTDSADRTERPTDWRIETRESRNAIGGDYLCAHLRRADFLHGREETTPSLRSAAVQISNNLKQLQLKTVFISSDCTGQEYHDLRSYLPRIKVVKFKPASSEVKRKLKPGGIAIIDQIICSHARYFIGTYESTFTYRIYEEREILGFPENTTFNTFCKTPGDIKKCLQNPVWPIVY